MLVFFCSKCVKYTTFCILQDFAWVDGVALRALTAVELNSYIAILVPPKHKNPHYSSGAKGKNFTLIATVHIYK